ARGTPQLKWPRAFGSGSLPPGRRKVRGRVRPGARDCGVARYKLGMSEYAQRFADNDIDFTILGDLTDQDLEKIGVVSLGHRRKLLRAIAELGSAPATAPVAPPATAPVMEPATAVPIATAARPPLVS